MSDSTNSPWIFVDEDKITKEGARKERTLAWVEVGVPPGTNDLTWEFRSDWVDNDGEIARAATFESVKAFVEGFLDEKPCGGRVTEEQLKEVREHGTLFVKRSLPIGYESSAINRKKEPEVPVEKLLLPAFVVELILCRYCSGVRRGDGKGEGKEGRRGVEEKEGGEGEEGEEGQQTSLTETLIPIFMILFFAILFCASSAVILYIGLLTTANDSVRDSSTYSARYVSLINDVLKFILRKDDDEEDGGQCVTSY
ncbi:hypothetical protein TrRE_jg10739 [Triparma retinervis]|uniref:Uncharacterized protein n=1 Tax=Triparma retinervis TaxID=2557542 RepID=A0A9W6ZA13_9STRA|nr:hypothetical protein TrRE_jg10739 [Triparma retinervis]